jgi:1-acyl-sn-glycerol-3-phosphate acyltransferase
MDAPTSGLSREVLIGAILDFLVDQDLLTLRDIRAGLEREIDRAGPDALLALRTRLTADHGWNYYPRDPLAQRIHHLLAHRFLGPGSAIDGAHYLAPLTTAPLVIVANHLSYADANVVEVLLQRSGGAAIADRLTAMAGPKVFTSRERRFSSLCFGTIKVPQSADVASEEAVLDSREIARAARRAIEAAQTRLREGDALLLFAEGRRSRTGAMQPMLAAAARYFDVPGTWVVPAGLTGPEALFPVDGATLRPAQVGLAIGRPILAETLLGHAAGERRHVMDAVGLAIAALLPPGYRGVYGDDDRFADAARILRHARG